MEEIHPMREKLHLPTLLVSVCIQLQRGRQSPPLQILGAATMSKVINAQLVDDYIIRATLSQTVASSHFFSRSHLSSLRWDQGAIWGLVRPCSKVQQDRLLPWYGASTAVLLQLSCISPTWLNYWCETESLLCQTKVTRVDYNHSVYQPRSEKDWISNFRKLVLLSHVTDSCD